MGVFKTSFHGNLTDKRRFLFVSTLKPWRPVLKLIYVLNIPVRFYVTYIAEVKIPGHSFPLVALQVVDLFENGETTFDSRINQIFVKSDTNQYFSPSGQCEVPSWAFPRFAWPWQQGYNIGNLYSIFVHWWTTILFPESGFVPPPDPGNRRLVDNSVLYSIYQYFMKNQCYYIDRKSSFCHFIN